MFASLSSASQFHTSTTPINTKQPVPYLHIIITAAGRGRLYIAREGIAEGDEAGNQHYYSFLPLDFVIFKRELLNKTELFYSKQNINMSLFSCNGPEQG